MSIKEQFRGYKKNLLLVSNYHNKYLTLIAKEKVERERGKRELFNLKSYDERWIFFMFPLKEQLIPFFKNIYLESRNKILYYSWILDSLLSTEKQLEGVKIVSCSDKIIACYRNCFVTTSITKLDPWSEVLMNEITRARFWLAADGLRRTTTGYEPP